MALAHSHLNAPHSRHGRPDPGSAPRAPGDPVERIAETILQYLGSRPNAVDTVEGVTDWWIPRQRYQEALADVQVALDRLVAEGLIEAATGHDGRVVYRVPRQEGDGRG
jgi:hypothetical protein